MKRLLFCCILALCFSMLCSSCRGDQCITCSYIEPTTGELFTEPEVCGSESVLDTKEDSVQKIVDFKMATDFVCVRN